MTAVAPQKVPSGTGRATQDPEMQTRAVLQSERPQRVPSSTSTGVQPLVGLQTAVWQRSPGSTQLTGVCWQPDPGAHVSLVQMFPSSQLSAVPLQTPARQVPFTTQLS